jgi:hypothetical protein
MSEDTVKDMLTIVYEKLVANPVIAQQTLGTDGNQRIKYYETPATADHDHLFVVIVPMDPPISINAGSDEGLSLQFTFQINVESHDRKACKQVQHEIMKEMFELGFGQLTAGLDEYFPETNRFVDARRYRGNTRLFDVNY